MQRGNPTIRAAGILAAVSALALLAGCGGGAGTSGYFGGSALDLFNTSSKATTANAAAPSGPEVDTDIECPDVKVRSGAATLTIGMNPKEQEPSPLQVRYQGSITRMARECHVAGGVMTMKVGIEGRIITGPAGGPGSVDVPLRLAVVQEGPSPKTIVSNFGKETVSVAPDSDRVNFTYIDSNISFPLPRPAGLIDNYVVYVGFDPLSLAPPKPQKKAPAPRKPRSAAKPQLR
jgi:hypothetical protein